MKDYQKPFKKLTFFSLSNPVPFNRQSYQNKRGLELVTSRSSGYKQVHKNSFISYILSDKFESCFWVIQKITPENLCKRTHDINYSSSVCPFESGKCGKEEEKTKIWISWERKELLRWNKNIFLFLKGCHLGGGGDLIKKIADTSFKPWDKKKETSPAKIVQYSITKKLQPLVVRPATIKNRHNP